MRWNAAWQWTAVMSIAAVVATGCGSSTRDTSSPPTTEAATTTSTTEAPSSTTLVEATSTEPGSSTSTAGGAVPDDFFDRVAPAAADVGPDYVFAFDPVGSEQDVFDKSLQDSLPSCSGSPILNPYFVPVTDTERAKGWYFFDTKTQALSVVMMLVMKSTTEAEQLMTTVRTHAEFPVCAADWVSAIDEVNATSDGPLKGHDVRFTSSNATFIDAPDQLGDEQFGWQFDQAQTVDGVASPSTTATSFAVRNGPVIVISGGPPGVGESITRILASKVRAALG